MFDFNGALQLMLPLETPATGHTRIHEAPMPDSHVTWQFVLGLLPQTLHILRCQEEIDE